MHSPSEFPVPAETPKPPALKAGSLSLAPLGHDVDFYDVDWQRVFGDIGWSYDGPLSAKVLQYLKADGTYDMDTARQDPQYGPWVTKYVDERNAPNIDAVCAILEEHRGSVSYVPIFTAIPDPMRLPPADRERVMQALLGHCDWLIRLDKLPELFACFEQLFPVWFDSFEILEERLPKGLRRGYIERMPKYTRGHVHDRVYDNATEVRAVIEREFPQAEWDELTECAKEHPDAIFYNRTFRQRWPNGLPLKKPEVVAAYQAKLRGKLLQASTPAVPRLEPPSKS